MGNGPKTENPLAAPRELTGRLKRMPCFWLSSKGALRFNPRTAYVHSGVWAYGDVIGGSNGASEIAPLESSPPADLRRRRGWLRDVFPIGKPPHRAATRISQGRKRPVSWPYRK